MNVWRTRSLLILASLLISFATLRAQAPSTAGTVYISFTVKEAAGRAITGLQQDDFRVIDNGVEYSPSFLQEDAAKLEYRIGYVPSNVVDDVRFRRIEVRVVNRLIAPLVKSVDLIAGPALPPAQ